LNADGSVLAAGGMYNNNGAGVVPYLPTTLFMEVFHMVTLARLYRYLPTVNVFLSENHGTTVIKEKHTFSITMARQANGSQHRLHPLVETKLAMHSVKL